MFNFIKETESYSFVFQKLHTISQVADCIGDFSVDTDRSKIKLFVLDDEGFNSDPLASVGYKDITKCTKFENVETFSTADIILCDIDGIGGDLDPGRQGLAVAENLKMKYPEKLVIIYTSKNIEAYGEMPKTLDGLIRKQGTMSDLAFELDKLYANSKNVIEVWKKTRDKMMDNNVSTKTIAFTEHYYCKSLLDKINLFEEPEVERFMSSEKIEKFLGGLIDIILKFVTKE